MTWIPHSVFPFFNRWHRFISDSHSLFSFADLCIYNTTMSMGLRINSPPFKSLFCCLVFGWRLRGELTAASILAQIFFFIFYFFFWWMFERQLKNADNCCVFSFLFKSQSKWSKYITPGWALESKKTLPRKTGAPTQVWLPVPKVMRKRVHPALHYQHCSSSSFSETCSLCQVCLRWGSQWDRHVCFFFGKYEKG